MHIIAKGLTDPLSYADKLRYKVAEREKIKSQISALNKIGWKINK